MKETTSARDWLAIPQLWRDPGEAIAILRPRADPRVDSGLCGMRQGMLEWEIICMRGRSIKLSL